MAFPTLQDGVGNVVTSNSGTWTLTFPANIVSGDLLLVFIGRDGGGNSGDAFDNGITRKMTFTNSSACTLTMGAKVCAGTETGTFTYTLGTGTEQGGWQCYRVPAAEWAGGDLGAEDVNASNGFDCTDGNNGTSTTPNPGSLNPANWDIEDTLWIAAVAVDTSRTISVYPFADNNQAQVSGGSTGGTLGICTTNSAAASVDPGTFTISNSDEWTTATFAIRPAAAATPVSFPPFAQPYPAGPTRYRI